MDHNGEKGVENKRTVYTSLTLNTCRQRKFSFTGSNLHPNKNKSHYSSFPPWTGVTSGFHFHKMFPLLLSHYLHTCHVTTARTAQLKIVVGLSLITFSRPSLIISATPEYEKRAHGQPIFERWLLLSSFLTYQCAP